MIDVGRKGEFVSVFGDHVAGEAFAVEHHLPVQFVVGAESSGFCVHVASARRILLNFR